VKPHRREPAEPLPVVMLDPGHGGKDPGAIGVSGTYEKHIALATAQELRRQLLATGRYRVELTRTRDVFIPLEDRVEMAQQRGAALFVSMHADALADHAIRGASVYTLSNDPSDLQSAMLAERENSVDRLVRRPRRRPSHDLGPEVSEIIMNMGLSRARADSVRMARSLVSSMDNELPMLTNPERHAGFVVLKAGSIPSVLVEMGFMSNARDEAALRKAEHRRLVAKAMQRAVDAYFGGITRSAT
jgi:N-acetylmuramoyl-L-alanine amidase